MSLFSLFSWFFFLLPVSSLPSEHSFSLSNLHSRQSCQPFYTSFNDPSSISPEGDAPFIALSPADSYQFTNDGLVLTMKPPQEGPVHASPDGVNDKLGQAAIVNSTFWVDYGRVTFEFKTTLVPGAVTAFIFIDAEKDDQIHLDEIDAEVVGKNPYSWQSNIFKPSFADPKPHYGVFSQTHRLPHHDDSFADTFHKISIEKRENQIMWSQDGVVVRTLNKQDTYLDGVYHFPSDLMRLQFGVWDGSGAKGTSSWSGGPIDWEQVYTSITATIRSVTVEC
ncbi:glycoside hydrolase family 16 protein [Collybiopsis luxurians FD-317 M1]|uniref:Glycoside hydrolase family 16 protein n=1 Tax=Collybiopsis luxurians FD-317 M1 TaxID=944289 RepID=A0A0D0BXR2_9AGAR|nr:glycoside hydrolase family 16 protein [Collybiopsis luxurians FD-317 M1]